jgi:hypothetical protein
MHGAIPPFSHPFAWKGVYLKTGTELPLLYSFSVLLVLIFGVVFLAT